MTVITLDNNVYRAYGSRALLIRLGPGDQSRGGAVLGEGQILDCQGGGFGATRQQIPHDQHQGDVAKAGEGLGLRGEDPFGGKLIGWGCLPLPCALGPDHALDSQSDYLSLGGISESRSTVHR
jgi:hypothetical protein